MNRVLTTILLVLGVSGITCDALAYCRTTVCDPRYTCDQDPEICCVIDPATGCDLNTAPISWPTNCVSYNIHVDGSKKLNIEPDVLESVLRTAYDSWLSADCGGSSISLAIDYRGHAQCGSPEYNLDHKDSNANIWMFRDEGTSTGSHGGPGSELSAAALAVTTVSFNEVNAQIYDVDVELLSYAANFSTSDDIINVDLESVVVHEAGHFLGLDHSNVPGATMAPGYIPGTIAQRDLSEDDLSGICATYPENRNFPGGKTCEPRGRYSPECNTDKGCGCRHAGLEARPTTPMFLGALLLGLFSVRRRRLGRVTPRDLTD